MKKFICNSLAYSSTLTSAIFTIVPEAFFAKYKLISQEFFKQFKTFTSEDVQLLNIIISRIFTFLVILLAVVFVYIVYLKLRKRTTIEGPNYSICVEYGNIFKTKHCKRVVNFDECFTTQVGNATSDINPGSICGQYLTMHPDLNIQQLINASQISPAKSKSLYKGNQRYNSGTIVPNGDDLLMAFAMLDERGKGRFFSRDEYIECLNLLWKEIEIYYSEKDVCVPILGAGTTTFDGGNGASISQQDLLDMMILSYKLSSHKIKAPHKLRIICKRTNGFSINNIKA